MAGPFDDLPSPAIDLSDLPTARLFLWRFLEIDGPDDARVQIEAFDGAAWHVLFENDAMIDDDEWVPMAFDLSPYRGATFRLRFGLQVLDDVASRGGGWSLDEVAIVPAESSARVRQA